MKNQEAYKIIMSRGDPIHVDSEELKNVIKAIKAGQPCKVRQGIFNPSFYVSIIEDGERVAEINRDNTYVAKHNRQIEITGEGEKKKYLALKPLKDIFTESPLRLTGEKPVLDS